MSKKAADMEVELSELWRGLYASRLMVMFDLDEVKAKKVAEDSQEFWLKWWSR